MNIVPLYKFKFILFFIAFMSYNAIPQSTVTGYVFNDSNQNGSMDPDEPGICGVAVTNLLEVVATDSSGYYQIPINKKANLISISLPEKYYGKIWFSTAELNSHSLNFPLTNSYQQKRFKFIHASDTHIHEGNLHRMERFRELVDSIQPAFVIITGDLVRDALRVPEEEARRYYELHIDQIEKISVPVWRVPGNHEIFGIERHKSLVSEQHPLYGKKMYHYYLGPNYYSFNYGGVHFIGFDSVNFEDLWYYGDIDSVQISWLVKDLKYVDKSTPVVSFNHIAFLSPGFSLSPFEEEGVAPTLISVKGKKRYRHIVGNAAEIIAILRERPYPWL